MKHLFLFSIILFSPFIIFSQDTIVKRNGEKLIVKIMEVNTDNIRYKKTDYIEGPLFMLLKQDISSITYSNGSKDSFENYVPPAVPKQNFVLPDLSIQTSGKFYYYKERKITERDMLAVAGKVNDPKLNLIIKSVDQKRFIQNMTLAGGITLFVVGLDIYARNQPSRGRGRGAPRQPTTSAQTQGQNNGKYLMLGGLACEVASIYFVFDRRKQAHILVGAYNKMIGLR